MGNAVRLIADDDDVVGVEIKIVYICSVKKRADDAAPFALFAEKRHQFMFVHVHMHERTHCGLDGLWVIEFHTVGRADDVPDAEPVGGADHGAEIARVGDMVKDEHRFAFRNVLNIRALLCDCKKFRRGLHRADTRHFGLRDQGHFQWAQPVVVAKGVLRGENFLHNKFRPTQHFHTFVPLHQKQPALVAELPGV